MPKPPRASGGVAAELGVVDPRKAVREQVGPPPTDIREKKRSQGVRRPGGDPDPPPAPVPWRPSPNDPDPYEEALKVIPRGRRSGKTGRVRVYHRAGEHGQERCWAFTLTAAGYQRLVTDRVLDHDGATYPNGLPVVPTGANPLDYPVRCGSCGTHSVECLQIELMAD